MSRPSNLARWREVQQRETEALVGPALDLAERLRSEGHDWGAVVERLNRRGHRTRLGARWSYTSLTQAVYKRRKRRAAA